MDVIFEVEGGSEFSIEVGFFDSILEMKEKVQKYQSIPVSKQTFIFNGQVLPDDGDIWKCEIFQDSRIQLIVAPDSDKSPSTNIQLNVKITSSNVHIPDLEMDLNDTVLKLKEKIHEIMENPVPVYRLILHATGTELQDHQLLRDCDNISDNAKIDVSFRPPTTILRSGGNVGGSKKLKVMVLPYKDGAEKIPVEVIASDKVGELRKELEKLNQQGLELHLPQDGRYFFIHKQSVMDDDKSFRWHHVGQGDTIDIFPGYVTDS